MHDFICCGKVLRIRDNLYKFLQRAKEQGRTSRCPIWIDAVCIDQSNDAEKSVQIPLMSEVYKQAQQVQVWLGDCTKAEGNAFLAINPMSRILNTNPRLIHNDDDLASLGLPPSSSPTWRAISKILARPWFTRLWVMQEVALARRVVILCGTGTILWEILNRFLKASARHTLFVNIFLPTAYDGWSAFMVLHSIRVSSQSVAHGLSYKVDMGHLIDELRTRDITNPADRVYGVLGLIHRDIRQALTIDTTSPPFMVFTKFTQCLIERYSTLVLNHTTSLERIADLPSWCPNFDSLPDTSRLGGLGDSLYEAGYGRTIDGNWVYGDKRKIGRLPNTHCGTRIVPGTGTIQAKGLALGEVREIVTLDHYYAIDKEDCLSLLKWEAACLAVAQQVYCFPNPNDVPDAYLRTLIGDADFTSKSQLRRCRSDTRPAYDDWISVIQERARNPNCTHNPDYRHWPGPYYTKLRMICDGRRFFATSGGQIGLGPAHTKPGDLICVFYGGDTPYILRKDPAADTFEFIGEAYVHGLMYGEALEMQDQGLVSETTITIR